VPALTVTAPIWEWIVIRERQRDTARRFCGCSGTVQLQHHHGHQRRARCNSSTAIEFHHHIPYLSKRGSMASQHAPCPQFFE